MKFSIYPNNTIINNILTYDADDYAFSTHPVTKTVDFTVIVNRLNLVVVDGSIVEVWGLCPHTAWQRANLSIPQSVTVGNLVVQGESENGYNYGLTKGNEWLTYVDYKNGWVTVGDTGLAGDTVKFMPDGIAMVKNQQLVSIWLHPQELPKV